jgi:hypothetical protein
MRGGIYFLVLVAVVVPLSILGCDKASPPAAAASADAPAGYTVMVSTDSGKSLVTQKPNVTTVIAALLATFPDLTTYFGNRPTIGSAYQDAHDPTTGGATFSATLNGQPVRGIVSCKLHNGGASVAVVFGRTDAPKADWEKLLTRPAAPAAATPVVDASDPNIPLKEYDYPDGTGSLGLADGWTTQGQSVAAGCQITGPASQMIVLHNRVNFSPPDSLSAKQRQRYDDQAANAVKTNAIYRLKPLPPMLIAPYTDPVTALPAVLEQFSKASEFNHGPTTTLDKIISSRALPCSVQNSKRALITFAFTKTLDGKSTAYREQIDVIAFDFTGTWTWAAQYNVSAPDATFDHDLPIMLAMVKSEKGNAARIQQVVQAIGQQNLQAGQQVLADGAKQRQDSFEQFQKDQQSRQNIHDAQQQQTQAGYDAHNQQFNDYELQRSRHSADFDESVLGTRTIYDTVTGQSGYANLTDVNGVVDSLNQAALDPNRFVQIPLRDQLYPLPQGK